MTKDEAIKQLRLLQVHVFDKDIIAIEMAINAMQMDINPEPRVYTYEEYINLPDETDIWVEWRNQDRIYAATTNGPYTKQEDTIYGTEYRVWSGRPTKLQTQCIEWKT